MKINETNIHRILLLFFWILVIITSFCNMFKFYHSFFAISITIISVIVITLIYYKYYFFKKLSKNFIIPTIFILLINVVNYLPLIK